MSAKSWNVGIIGCGRIAGVHAGAYRSRPGFRLAACVNPTADGLKKFQEQWEIPNGYGELAGLLAKERLDVISLCSPSEFHAAQIEEILSSPGKPKLLFAEKPVCLREQDGRSLLSRAEGSGVKVLVNHSRRFDPAHRELRPLTGGALGELTQARCLYYGGWLNNGAHLIDTLRMLLPQPLSLVSSRLSGHGRGADANLDLELRAGEAPVEVRAFDERHYQLFEMDLRFERGRVRLLDAGSQILAEKVELNDWEERELKTIPGFPKAGLVSPLAEAAREITRVLEGTSAESDLGADLPNALQTMRILWQAQSMAQNAPRQEVTHSV